MKNLNSQPLKAGMLPAYNPLCSIESLGFSNPGKETNPRTNSFDQLLKTVSGGRGHHNQEFLRRQKNQSPNLDYNPTSQYQSIFNIAKFPFLQ